LSNVAPPSAGERERVQKHQEWKPDHEQPRDPVAQAPTVPKASCVVPQFPIRHVLLLSPSSTSNDGSARLRRQSRTVALHASSATSVSGADARGAACGAASGGAGFARASSETTG